jgi:hypothetical protein
MEKKTNFVTNDGFSDRFFETLAKEHDKVADLANKQRQLKQKHNHLVLQ